MTSPVGGRARLARRPLYRYGMLAVIVVLLGMGVWEHFAFRGERRHHPLGLVLALMLLVNHVVQSFLTDEQQTRVQRPRFLLALGFLIYVVYVFAQQFWLA